MKKRKAQAVIFYYAENNSKQFLLLKMNERRNHYWQNITGFVEDGEDFIDGAKREALEETSLKLQNVERVEALNTTFEFHDRWGNDVIENVFVIEAKEKWDVILDITEHQDYKWIDEKELTRDSVHYESNYKALKKVRDEF